MLAQKLLPPQVSHLVRCCANPLLQPIFDFEAPRMVDGQAALVGDAAFVARPHVGTGVTKAALDAACLADSLLRFSEVGTALNHYEQQRLLAGSALVNRGRYLGAFLGRGCGVSLSEQQKLRLMHEFGAAGVSATSRTATAK